MSLLFVRILEKRAKNQTKTSGILILLWHGFCYCILGRFRGGGIFRFSVPRSPKVSLQKSGAAHGPLHSVVSILKVVYVPVLLWRRLTCSFLSLGCSLGIFPVCIFNSSSFGPCQFLCCCPSSLFPSFVLVCPPTSISLSIYLSISQALGKLRPHFVV